MRGFARCTVCVVLAACGGGSADDDGADARADATIADDGGCVPGAEVCNSLDDDCDGMIDEGGVCPTDPTCTQPPTGGAPVYAWDRVIPGALGIVDVAIAPSGMVVAVGQFDEPADLGGGVRTPAGDADGFVVAFSPQGDYLWDHTFGSAVLDIMGAVAVDADGNVFVGGAIGGPFDFGGGVRTVVGNADAYVVSYDAAGQYRWDADISGSATNIGDLAAVLAVGADGTLVAAGRFGGDIDVGLGVDPSPGPARISTFVVELDRATGAPVWDAYLRASLGVEPYGLAVDAGGAPVVGGELNGDIDFGGGVRAGHDDDGFAVQLDATGGYVWDVTFGTPPGLDDAFAAAPLGGGVAIAGRFAGSIALGAASVTSAGASDGVAFGVSPAGAVTWTGQWAGAGGEAINDLAASPLGGAVAAGVAGPGTVNLGGADRPIVAGAVACPVVGYSATGAYQWDVAFGGAAAGASCIGLAAAAGPGGVIAVTGQFQGTVDFGGGGRTATGTVDAVVAVLCP
jgi:hypothetical protein